jgi:5'-nucleotidase
MSVRRATLGALLAIAASAAIAVSPAGVSAAQPVKVRIVAFNDFHGNLEPPEGGSGQIGDTPAGGIAYLATHVRELREGEKHSIVVSAGDLIGASQLISGLFHDEPTVAAADLLGLSFDAVGNHELDHGWRELVRLQDGSCHPVDGCATDEIYTGARFRFLAANVIEARTGEPLFPASAIRRFGPVEVGFIGIVTRSVPSLVSPEAIDGLRIEDEASAVNREAARLRAKGVEAIVVLIHEGGWQTGDIDGCEGPSGPIVEIVRKLDPSVDVVISGHTHQAYRCTIDGRLVTSAKSFGRLVTRIDLTIDPKTGDVETATGENLIVTRDVPPASDEASLVDRWSALAEPVAERVVGTIAGPLSSEPLASGQAPLGGVITDARLEGMASESVVAAFVSSGSVRTDLVGAAPDGSGDVTYEDLYDVQSWGNNMVATTLTGAQLHALLELQFDNPSPGEQRWLQVSRGFTYAWSVSAPAGAHVDPTSIAIGGVPVDPEGTYRVAIDSYLASGGDRFAPFEEGTDTVGGPTELDVLSAWFEAHGDVAVPADDRVTALP